MMTLGESYGFIGEFLYDAENPKIFGAAPP